MDSAGGDRLPRVTEPELRTNPNALPDAEPPRIGRYPVNGTILYAEVRGSGPAVLLIHAGGEDAEQWRPVAERLTGFTVVTYDRRGTLRSGRDAWQGGGSAQHADDAAGLLAALGLDDVVVFGASSGGIPALQLALRHPELIRRALIYEPGYFRQVPGGEEFQRPANEAVVAHLAAHPGDWVGAYAAFRRVAGPPPDGGSRGVFTPPPGEEWYAQREDANAEALVVDDVPILSRELVDEQELARAAADIRFSFGTASLPIFQEIATHLAAVRSATPDSIDGAGHLMKYLPDAGAAYVRAQSGASSTGEQSHPPRRPPTWSRRTT
jgi:pimeloyl-ACP methyl ester carboxylesterase